MVSNSIKRSILFTVTTSLLTLACALILVQSIYEAKSLRESTNTLVLEQVELVLSKLDVYSLESQRKYVTKTLFNLRQINGVKIFDKNCKALNQKPKNLKLPWDCKSSLSEEYVIYKSNLTLSDSNDSIKYVVAKVNKAKVSVFDRNGSYVILFSLLLILMTILALNYLFKLRVLLPLEKLKNIIGQPGPLYDVPDDEKKLPIELRPIFNDVLERDEILRQKNIEVNKASKEALKNEMRTKFVHNIKFPLTLIRDFILEKKSVENNQDTYLAALKDLENLSSKLSSETLSVPREVNVADLISSAVRDKRVEFAASKSKVVIDIKNEEKSLKVKIDPIEMRTMVSNLINNAKESVPRGKVCEINIFIRRENKEVIIELTDNGIGIPPDKISKLFIKGSTFNKPGGTGMGLYHAKEVVDNANGDIRLTLNNEAGTKVILRLPTFERDYLSYGSKPFKNVMVEDFELSQTIWLEHAINNKINFAVFSSPSEFEEHVGDIDKNANIYVDSNFPDTKLKGEDWSKSLINFGFENIYMCSTAKINLKNKDWVKGVADKNRPFIVNESID